MSARRIAAAFALAGALVGAGAGSSAEAQELAPVQIGTALCVAGAWSNPSWVTADGFHLHRTVRYCDGLAHTTYRLPDGRGFGLWTGPGIDVVLQEDGSGRIVVHPGANGAQMDVVEDGLHVTFGPIHPGDTPVAPGDYAVGFSWQD